MSDTLPNEVREAGAAAIANRWHGLKDCPGDMYEREAAALFDAALSALEAAGWEVNRKGTREALTECAFRLRSATLKDRTQQEHDTLALCDRLTASNPKEKPDV